MSIPIADDPATSATTPAPAPAWTTLAAADGVSRAGAGPVSGRRVVLQMFAAAIAVMLVVSALGIVVVRRISEREAMNDASQLTDLLARAVVEPALEDTLLVGDPGAVRRLDQVVRSRVLSGMFVRVKVWSPEGVVLYADTPELIGEKYSLGADQRAVLTEPATVAEVSELGRPENRLEQGQGRLVEVYRPIWMPSGQPVLFETYTDYDAVNARTRDLWRGFGGIVVSSLLLFCVLLTPVLWTLLERLRRAREGREELLQHAIDASHDERRRIAADLHDGVVQELVAASLLVSGAAERTAARGDDPEQVAHLRSAATAVRSSVGALRTLLVDIYPPNLASAGLVVALEDLGSGLRGRGMEVLVDADPDAAAALDETRQRLVYRFTQECLRNIVKHAGADRVEVLLQRGASGESILLEVADDGAGMDPGVLRGAGPEGHFGVRLLADLAREHGAALHVATAVGQGTRWRLEILP
ncbi:MAG: integral membrane sensor signal transduction histidine kinase [Kineosporiaceae bacterium]|nr:integral membrane sensor signal transduction histidine kinase [Kineosporiaceae bacterium]